MNPSVNPLPTLLRRLALAAASATLALFAGCATSYVVDSDVQTFSSIPTLPPNPAYRFERLPSQESFALQQGQLEAMADPALYRAGLRRDDAAPKYSVLVGARVQRTLSPWDDPWAGWGMGWGPREFGFVGRFGWRGGFPAQQYYQREVSVIVRELAGNRVVFESHAANDGPWPDSTAVLPALFDAALAGFPNAPLGVRKVNVRVDTAPAPAATTIPASAPAPAPAPTK